MRSVPQKFFNTSSYPTIAYSVSKDGLYCVHCTLFRTSESQLVGIPYRDWSNAVKFIDKHCRSPDHLSAAGEKTQNFTAVTTGQKPSVYQQQKKVGEQKLERTRYAVKSVIATLEVLGRQGLAIRGNTDERSNFMAMLNFCAETDPLLAEHLQKADENMKYTSHQIQNEIVDLQGGQILEKILSWVKKAGWFSVIADESSDISKLEQVALILRYLLDTMDGVVVREDFVSFKSTRNVKGATVKEIIVKQLKGWDLDLNKLIGQGYDGAGNMEGKVNGVQALIRKDHPQATYVWCKNHNLNLMLRHSTQEPYIRNMYGTLETVLYFITCSPKRVAIYMQHAGPNAKKLVPFSDTRWSQHTESAVVFRGQFKPILATLHTIMHDSTNDKDVKANASSYYYAIQSFEFIVSLFVAEDLVPHTLPVTKAMEGKQMDLVRTAERCERLVSFFKDVRADTTTSFPKVWEKITAFSEEHNIPVTKPRTTGRQTQRSNIPSDTPEEYWRLNCYNMFLDHLITQFYDKMCKPLPRLKAEYLMPHKLSLLTDKLVEEIKAEYTPLIPSPETLDHELREWRHDVTSGAVTTDCLAKCIDATKFLPNINTIFRILLTMPVSTASAERSFSGLRRLKTWLRNLITDERLTSLALIHTHRDIPIDREQCFQDFRNAGRRFDL